MLEPLIFRTHLSAEGIYHTLFGGIYLREGLPEIIQYLLLPLLLGNIVCIYAYSIHKSLTLRSLSYFCTGLFFVMVVYLLNSPWDELFINLKHSFNLSHHNVFSFHKNLATEGIVDFLPYFLIGMMGKIGFDLVELAFIQSLVGGMVCLWAIDLIANKLNASHTARMSIVLLSSLFPPLCFNSAQGFATSLFAGCILASLALLVFSKPNWKGYLLLSTLALIRLEAAFFVMLVLFYIGLQTKDLKKMSLLTVLVFAPLLALSLFRWVSFGSVVPVPITYKSSFGSIHYLKVGIRNFVKDFDAGLGFLSLGIVSMLLLKKTQKPFRLNPGVFSMLLLLAFVAPYYLSGGDWFPPHWGRYTLPLNIFLWTWAMIIMFETLSSAQNIPQPRSIQISFLLTLLYLSFHPSHSYLELRSALLGKHAGRGDHRVEELSKIGRHFKLTTSQSDRIASSEVATLMYFSEREPVDLLGVTNIEIAKTPLIETNNLAYRRRKPEIVAELMPEFVWAYDYTSFISSDADNESVLKEVRKRHLQYEHANEFRFGGMKELERLGYIPLVVIYENNFNTLYYVSPKVKERHLEDLKHHNFQKDILSQTKISSLMR